MKLKIIMALTACTLFAAAGVAFAQQATPDSSTAIVQHTVQVGAQKFYYSQAGAGATTIVLLHGWPQSAHQWHKVIPLLADRFSVVAPDLPGVGGSSKASERAHVVADFEKVALARNLHGFIKTLGERRIILVGHDIGGMVAYAYARLYPTELAGVAIMDVPLPGVAPWDVIKTIPQAWHFDFHNQKPLAERLVAERQASYFRYFIDSNAKNPAAISDADVAIYAAAYGSADGLSAGFGFYRAFPADEKFNTTHTKRLDLPVMLAAAEGSLGKGVLHVKRGLRALGVRNIRIAMISNSGHWIAEENPSATAAAIASFADSIR